MNDRIEAARRGRPPLDKAARDRQARRAVLHKGMVACYEIIDKCRKELAELDAPSATKEQQL
jgi:hypothetical protein